MSRDTPANLFWSCFIIIMHVQEHATAVLVHRSDQRKYGGTDVLRNLSG